MEIPYAADLKFVNRFLIAASAADLVAAELLVPWPTTRWILLVLGVLSLVWVLAYARSLTANPHTLDDEELRLRFSWSTDIPIPRHRIKSVRAEWSGSHGRTVEFADDTLSITAASTTSVHLTLTEPTEIQGHTVRFVRFHADEPAKAVQAFVTEASSRSA
ncbi:hypothetical protein FKR81_29915 [Lentzea tibetensis]|uniref:PH domain-containing protein n=1 Tax=Lentzea tibetensis TaxID=2591470 RepID=A0A563ELQ5_9PSEU|nr:hypothetical protein [Lentzea tibetensis]TWP48192.1 hypothetical protein FKR81_29915 [Lentzea tibetensis]